MMKLAVAVCLFFVHCGLCRKSNGDNYVCRDENNNIVDWFYMYKLPKNKYTKNSLIKEGVAYMFITPDTIKNGWTLSTKSINDSSSMPGLTLKPLYSNREDHLAVIYNDQPPEGDKDAIPAPVVTTTKKPPKGSRKPLTRRHVELERQWSLPDDSGRKRVKNRKAGGGHTKGVLLGDDKNGIWLVHSVPKFPPIPESDNSVDKVTYSYPMNAMRYGQSFLCLSLTAPSLDDVGQQMSFNEPKIVYSRVPKTWQSQFSSIMGVINNLTVTSAPWSRTIKLTTRRGVPFLSFAKSGNYKDDLYEGLVAQSLKTDLFVESWINGPGVLPSDCSVKYKVNNVKKVAFADKSVAFSSHSDHSKWAVSVPNTNKKKGDGDNWICVGDINRASSQELRGGGTVCTQNADLWENYKQVINDVEPCISQERKWREQDLLNDDDGSISNENEDDDFQPGGLSSHERDSTNDQDSDANDSSDR